MQPNQPPVDASLPAPRPMQPPAANAPGEGDLLERTIGVAKQVVGDRQQDPYALSQELWRVKAAYLAEAYNISVQSVDGQ